MSAAFLRAGAGAALARADYMSGPRALRLVLVLCVLAVSSAGISPVRAESPRFSIVAPGIGHATFKGRSADAEPFSGHAFKIDLDEAELRLVPAGDPSARRTVEQIVARTILPIASSSRGFPVSWSGERCRS
jgi:hypothetical protein